MSNGDALLHIRNRAGGFGGAVQLCRAESEELSRQSLPARRPLVRDPGRRRHDLLRSSTPRTRNKGKRRSSSRPARNSKPRGPTRPPVRPRRRAPGRRKAGPRAEDNPKAKPPSGPGGTLQLAADASDLAYDKPSLSSKPGKVTIDFTNPSALEHDVAIEGDNKEIAGSELIAESKTSVSAELAAGHLHLLLHRSGASRSGDGRDAHRQVGLAGGSRVGLACANCGEAWRVPPGTLGQR